MRIALLTVLLCSILSLRAEVSQAQQQFSRNMHLLEQMVALPNDLFAELIYFLHEKNWSEVQRSLETINRSNTESSTPKIMVTDESLQDAERIFELILEKLDAIKGKEETKRLYRGLLKGIKDARVSEVPL